MKKKKKACRPKTTSIHSLNTYLNHIKTHIDNVSEGSAVIPCAWVTLEGIGEVTTIKVVVAKVIMTSPNGFLDTINLCGWERESERGEVILVLCQVLCKTGLQWRKKRERGKNTLCTDSLIFSTFKKEKRQVHIFWTSPNKASLELKKVHRDFRRFV